MQFKVSAALAALAFATPLPAQTAASPARLDARNAPVLPGSWRYSPVPDGSQAMFLDTAARPQLVIHCTRATRRVTIARPAGGAAPFLLVWTSSMTRNLPASFDPTTARLRAELAAFDPLLDAIAFSRSKFAVGISGSPSLVVPAWPEAARAIEDCRN